MNAQAVINKPEDIEITLTLTFNLAQWKKLASQLGSYWPASDLHATIQHMVYRLERKVDLSTSESGI